MCTSLNHADELAFNFAYLILHSSKAHALLDTREVSMRTETVYIRRGAVLGSVAQPVACEVIQLTKAFRQVPAQFVDLAFGEHWVPYCSGVSAHELLGVVLASLVRIQDTAVSCSMSSCSGPYMFDSSL